jgi:hypothetical protein
VATPIANIASSRPVYTATQYAGGSIVVLLDLFYMLNFHFILKNVTLGSEFKIIAWHGFTASLFSLISFIIYVLDGVIDLHVIAHQLIYVFMNCVFVVVYSMKMSLDKLKKEGTIEDGDRKTDAKVIVFTEKQINTKLDGFNANKTLMGRLMH